MVWMEITGEAFKAHIAATDSPFVILFEHERADQADDGTIVGKDTAHMERRLISPLRRSSGLVPAICGQCSLGKAMYARTSSRAPSIISASFGARSRKASLMGMSVFSGFLGEEGLHRGDDAGRCLAAKCARAFRIQCTRQRCRVARKTFDGVARRPL